MSLRQDLARALKDGHITFADGDKAGQAIRLALAPSDVAISEELDTFVAGFKPMGFRADDVSPPLLVDKRTDKYRKFDDDDAFELVDVETSDLARVRQVDPRSELVEFTCRPRALGSLIPRATERQAAPLYNVEEAALRRISNALMLDREVRVWTALTTAGSWATAQKETLTNGWNDVDNSDPISDIQERLVASYQEVTDIWMNEQVVFAFLNHPKVRDYIKSMLGNDAPAPGGGQQDFQLPGLPPIHKVSSKYKSGSNLVYALTDSVVLTRTRQGSNTSAEEVETFKTFREKADSNVGWVTREYDVEDAGLEGARMLVAGHSETTAFVSALVGGLIANVLT